MFAYFTEIPSTTKTTDVSNTSVESSTNIQSGINPSDSPNSLKTSEPELNGFTSSNRSSTASPPENSYLRVLRSRTVPIINRNSGEISDGDSTESDSGRGPLISSESSYSESECSEIPPCENEGQRENAIDYEVEVISNFSETDMEMVDTENPFIKQELNIEDYNYYNENGEFFDIFISVFVFFFVRKTPPPKN